MVQIAEGGLAETSNILTRLRELGVQAASDTIGDQERGFVNIEVQQLKSEIQRLAQSTRFGSTKLLDGSGGVFEIQVDINNDDFEDRIEFDSGKQVATLDALGIESFDFSDKNDARESLEVLEDAQRQVNGYRANLGAIQNRLVSTSENLNVAVENFSAANARVRDTDVADSTATLASGQILQQAAIGILAQANQQPSAALRLLG